MTDTYVFQGLTRRRVFLHILINISGHRIGVRVSGGGGREGSTTIIPEPFSKGSRLCQAEDNSTHFHRPHENKSWYTFLGESLLKSCETVLQ